LYLDAAGRDLIDLAVVMVVGDKRVSMEVHSSSRVRKYRSTCRRGAEVSQRHNLCESAQHAESQKNAKHSEEYQGSEKYQIRQRDRNSPGSQVPLITALNMIRHANPALQSNDSLRFHSIDNHNLICHSKSTAGSANAILAAVDLDSFNEQPGWTTLGRLGIRAHESFQVQDPLSGALHTWNGGRNYVALRPGEQPAHIFCVSRSAGKGTR